MEGFRKEFIHNDERKNCKIIFNNDGIEYQSKNNTGKTYVGRNIYHCFFPYGSIKKLELDKSMRLLAIYFYADGRQELLYFNAKNYMKDRELKKSIEFAQKQIACAATKEVVFYDQLIVEDKFANETQNIMLCEMCSCIFRYTDEDVKRYFDIYDEKKHEINKLLNDAIFNAAFGTHITTQMATYRAEDKKDQLLNIPRFDHCPKCKSTKTKRITEQELKEIQEKENTPSIAATSSADEIKKFKDLLDSGIITQEEFDAKKRQLLGL